MRRDMPPLWALLLWAGMALVLACAGLARRMLGGAP
jgi:hypothetical protein